MAFQKATKAQAKLRMVISGVSGSGKTYSALAIAQGLGEKVALIDTEHGSASKYSDIFSFDTQQLTTFSPSNFIAAMKEAEQARYDVLIIDSLSHAWMGKGGVLDIVDAAAERARGNSMAGWKAGTPEQNRLVEGILQSGLHIIATLRAKTDYSIDKDDKGKTSVKKLGLAPVQREGIEFEFDVAGFMNGEHALQIDKTRCPALSGQQYRRPDKDLGLILKAWLSDGAVGRTAAPTPAPAPTEREPGSDDGDDVDPAPSPVQEAAAIGKALAEAKDEAALNALVPRWQRLPFDLKTDLKPKFAERKAQLTTSTAQT